MNHLNHGPDTSEDECFDPVIVKVDIEMPVHRPSFLKPHHAHLPLRTDVAEAIELSSVILEIGILLVVEEGEGPSIRSVIDPVADQDGALIQEHDAGAMSCSLSGGALEVGVAVGQELS